MTLSQPSRRFSVGPVIGALFLFVIAFATGCGGDKVAGPHAPRVFHASPGPGQDCARPQDCLDAAAPGDTVELAGGVYDSVGAWVLTSNPLPTVCNFMARDGVVLRAARGESPRIDGRWDPGRVGVLVPEGVSDFTIDGVRFDNCDPAISMTGGRLHLRNCVFVTGTHAIDATGTTLDIRDCRFEEYVGEALVLRDCDGTVAGSSLKGDGYFFSAAGSRGLVLEDLLMAYSCFGGITLEGGTVTARRITIVQSGMVPGTDSTAITVTGGAVMTLERCLIANNKGFGIRALSGGQVVIRCSDLFNNGAGNYEGCPDMTGTDGNIATDPKFCSVPDSNFRLQASSPARTAECGSMGYSGDVPCASSGNDVGLFLARRAGQKDGAEHHQPH